jgi:hypothetical protein
MTVMAAGGRTSPRKAQPATPRATCLRRGMMMDRTVSLCIQPPAAALPLRLRLPRSESDAHAIRYTVRSMVACPRHPTTQTGAEGEPQQADDPPDAKGQSRQGRNGGQARRGVFGARWATGHGIRTLRDRKPMTDSSNTWGVAFDPSVTLHQGGEIRNH